MNQGRADSIRKELKTLIADKSQLTLPLLRGQVEWIAKLHTASLHSPETWVLQAQVGTVEKFENLIAKSALENSIELIALARNVFENLIWLKLFNKDRHFGLIFYRRLLQQQIESQEQAIEKAMQEIALFRELSKEESPDFEPILHLLRKSEDSAENAKIVNDYIKSHEAVVDAKARATFSLYAHKAKVNGFDFQASLIEEQSIPCHQERIDVVKTHLKNLQDALPTGLSSAMQSELDNPVRWKWDKRASSVGMSSHYKFLYSYTSRLLHATPMSLITPQELDDMERCTLLDYLYVAIKEAYIEIERFSYPGKVNVFLVEEVSEGV